MIICFLGRQPELGLAELQAVFHQTPRLIGDRIASLDINVDLALTKANRLGSIIKLAETIDPNFVVSKTSLNELATKLFDGITSKITLGISYYNRGASRQSAISLGKELKQVLQERAHSVRLVPSISATLSSATVLHNGLANNNPKKVELNVVGNLLSRTIFVQDIDAYTFRDRRRPRRDARNGMLPPKLAQTMVNLAVGTVKANSSQPINVLDPFCGTGVILQEAALMGYQVYGTDLNPQMIDNTEINLNWLNKTHHLNAKFKLTPGDATTFDWQAWTKPDVVNAVATETYLGKPYTSIPARAELQNNITNCNAIISKFLSNIAAQLPSGSGLCIGVPAWYIRDHIYHLPCLSQINQYGLVNQTIGANLIYHRPGQIVGRELLVLQKR